MKKGAPLSPTRRGVLSPDSPGAGRRGKVDPSLLTACWGLCWLNREVGGTNGVFTNFLGGADSPLLHDPIVSSFLPPSP